MKKLWILPVLLLAGSFLFLGCPPGPGPGATDIEQDVFAGGELKIPGAELRDDAFVEIAGNGIQISYDTDDVSAGHSWVYRAFIDFDPEYDISDYNSLEVKWSGIHDSLNGVSISIIIHDGAGNKVAGKGIWSQSDQNDFGTILFKFADAEADTDEDEVTWEDSDQQCASIEISCEFALVEDWKYPGSVHPDNPSSPTTTLDGLKPLVITSIKFIGTESTPEPEEPAEDDFGEFIDEDELVYKLSGFTYAGGSPNAQKGWNSDDVEDDNGNHLAASFEWEIMQNARYLIVESKGSNNAYGFGGMEVILQGDGNDWSWSGGTTNVLPGWTNFDRNGDTIYLVIELDTLNSYDSFIGGEKGRIVIAYYQDLVTELDYQNAYLVLADIEKPVGATDMVNSSKTYGYITKDLDIDDLPLSEPVFYTVSFDANGGTGTMAAMEDVRRITLPANSFTAPADKVFDGWAEGSATGTKYAAGVSYNVTANVTFYAVWKGEYTVSFDANGGTGTGPADMKAVEGDTITLPANTFTAPAGYTFSGNWAAGSATGSQFAVGYDEYEVTADLTFYAVWVSEGTTYTVSFDANGGGGTGPADIEDIEPNDSITLPANSFTAPADKEFAGWAEGSAAGTVRAVGYSHSVTGDITFYAVWKDIYVPNAVVDGADYTVKLEGLDMKAATPGTGSPGAFLDLTEAFPNDFDIEDYVKFTIRAKFFNESGDEIAITWGLGNYGFASDETETNIVGGKSWNLGLDSIQANLPAALTNTPAYLYVESAGPTVKSIEITEITFHVPVTEKELYNISTGWIAALGTVGNNLSGNNVTLDFQNGVDVTDFTKVVVKFNVDFGTTYGNYIGGSVEGNGDAEDGSNWVNCAYWGGYQLVGDLATALLSYVSTEDGETYTIDSLKKIVMGSNIPVDFDHIDSIWLE